MTSDIVNPFSVSFLMLLLLSFNSGANALEALKWLSISLAVSVLPVFVVIIFLVRYGKLDGIFIRARQQRNWIYLLATVCAVSGCIILYYLGAPKALVASFVAAFLAMVLFMFINLWWKISVHTAFVAASVTVLIALYGIPGMVAAVLLPLVVWSRVELEHHSPAQVATGALLAALIVVGVFYLFGLIGPATTV